jgi:adenine-specific DNA-methyltransferase
MPTLQFKGKQFVQNHHLVVPYHELIPRKNKSLTDKVSLHDNLIIHGDNLLALKALLPTYAGKIKCIYIDPPYNTGNEKWVYNDNVNSPMMQEWLGKVVDREDLTRHDKWLCMMMPRLKLLRELLREDGVIFVSIDDSEFSNLKALMDEVFSEDNFLASIIWQHSIQPKGYLEKFSIHHNYLVCYQKTGEFSLSALKRTEEHNKNYSNPDNDPKGPWRPGDVRNALYRPNLIFDIETPSGKTIKPPKNGWRWSKETINKKITSGEIVFSDDETRIIRKIYLSQVKGRAPETIWFGKDVGTTRDATEELKEIFNGESPFETPKPRRLVSRIIELVTDENSEDIVLDSFAGSGTTAHAVLSLNKEDGGKRQFILVECEDYADEITAERVRRVIKGVKTAKDEQLREGLGGTFSYFELGKPIELQSILSGKNLPTYKELARYIFYTATGEEFDESALDESRSFIGTSKEYEVYLFYKPDIEYLKNTALTLDRAKALGPFNKKKRLVFAPTKYLDQEHLDRLRIDFAQLPFEIYRMVE